MPMAIAVAAAISFLRIEVSPYSGSDLPSIENVWLRCRANELQISQEENSLTLSKKNAALHLIAIDQQAQCLSLQRRAASCVCAAACGKIAHIFCV